MKLRHMSLMAESAGLVVWVYAAAPQGDQGREVALPQVEQVGKGNMPDLQHNWECLLAPSSP